MTEIALQELGAEAAGVIEHVRAGERVDITDRGVVVARVVPARTPRNGAFVIAARGAERC